MEITGFAWPAVSGTGAVMLWQALSALMLHHGIRVSPRDLAEQSAQVPEELIPEVAVVSLAEYGLKASVFSTKKLNEVYFFPAAIRLITNEWAIVKSFKNNRVNLEQFDKTTFNVQKIEIEFNELNKIHDGTIITVEKIEKIQKENENTKSSEWFSSVFWRLKSHYGDCVIAAILINLLALAGSMFSMNVYDRIIPNAAFNSLWAFAIGVFVAGLVEFGLRSLRAYVLDDAGKKADLLLSASIYKKTLNLAHDQRPASSGQWASQIREFESVRDFVSSSTLVVLTDLPFSILFFGVIFWMGGSLVWIPVIFSILIILCGAITQIPIRKSVERYQYENTYKHSMLIESLERLETIEALGAKPVFQGKWERISASASRSAMASRMASAFASNMSQYLQQTANTALIVAGVYLIVVGQLTVGALIGCSILAGRAMSPLAQIAGLLARWHNTKLSFGTVDKLMKLEVRQSTSKNYVSLLKFKSIIKISNLTFKYPRTDINVLSIENLDLYKGGITAVMGPVGSGKTTFLKIIAGLLMPSSGQLLIDGIDIKQLSPADWRSQVAWVSQDAVLFRGSLRENLLIASPMVSDDKFMHILKICGVDNLIRNHPQGLDMQIGEAGYQLSGGQRQIVSLARALLSDISIILLDEPTSSLDMNSEKILLQNLKSEFQNKIIVIATHRPGPLEIADRLIVLDNGKLAANGLKESVLQDIKNGNVKRTSNSHKKDEEIVV